MAFLQGKKILITGLLSNRSIAYGIAQACKREGAELAFTYVGERFKDRITDFAKEFDSDLVFDCDVGSDEQIDALFADLGKSWTSSTAWCTPSALRRAKRLPATSWKACPAKASRSPTTFRPTVSRHWPKPPLPMLQPNAALLTLTYLGSMRVASELQHHGPGQGFAGSQRALPGRVAGPERRTGQRHFRRPDQDAGRQRHQGLQQDAQLRQVHMRRCAAM